MAQKKYSFFRSNALRYCFWFVCIASIGAGLLWFYYSVVVCYGQKSFQAPREQVAVGADDSEVTTAEPLPTGVVYEIPQKSVVDLALFQKQHLLLATTIAKTSEAGTIGRDLSDGLFLHLTHATKNISLMQKDDSGMISRAIPLVYDLLTKTQFFFSPTGEIVFDKIYRPLVAKNILGILFPAIGMRAAVTEDMPIVWFRPPYSFEIGALLQYAIQTLKQTKIALFYEESSWGLEAKEAAEKVLKEKYGLQPSGLASYQPHTVTIDQAVGELKKAAPQVILCLATGRPTYNFIRRAINEQMHTVSFLGLSCTAHIAPQLKKTRGITLVAASVVPNPHTSQLPIVQQYRILMQQYLPNKGLSAESLEGYISSVLLEYFIKKVGPNASFKELLDTIGQTKKMFFKGLFLQYKKQTLSWSVWLNKGVDSEWDEYSDRVTV